MGRGYNPKAAETTQNSKHIPHTVRGAGWGRGVLPMLLAMNNIITVRIYVALTAVCKVLHKHYLTTTL